VTGRKFAVMTSSSATHIECPKLMEDTERISLEERVRSGAGDCNPWSQATNRIAKVMYMKK
jgi:hypothetical protein